MSIAKIIEISSESATSLEDAITQGIARAIKPLADVRGKWVRELKAKLEKSTVVSYRVDMKVALVLHK